MDLFNFIFRLGVVFAIFGFIWGLINLGIRLLTIGRPRQLVEVYILKAIQYILLVDVTFLICYDKHINGFDTQSQLVFGAVILVMYFVGKLQQQQKKQFIFQFYANGMMQNHSGFNLRAEIGVISVAILMFIIFCFQPQWAYNPISEWFCDAIINIEDTPIFGFIFKIIGFFFLFNIVMKVVNGIMMLLSGKAFQKTNQKQQDSNHFDDYEEL